MATLDEETWAGKKFGASADGIGAVASMGRRMAAFLIDVVACTLLALAFTWPQPPGDLSLAIWAGMTLLSVGVFGMTPGQWVLGIRVASIRGAAVLGAWAIPRTALIFLLVPPLFTDSDGRGLHDRLCRTIVLRMR